MRDAVYTDLMGQIEELQVLSTRVRVLTAGSATEGRYEIAPVIACLIRR
jgi:hypothetical protein